LIFVQKNRDSLRRFLEGDIEGIHYMINHKDESVIVFSKILKNSDLKPSVCPKKTTGT